MRGAVFDLDGLIIDSEPLWRLAEREIFGRVGLELSDDDCRRTTGLRADEVVAYWFERHPWSGSSRGDVLRDLEDRVVGLVRARGRAMPGVDAVLSMLGAARLRLAIASSSSKALIEVVLATLRLEGVFEVVCSGEDEARGKPDPAVYRTAVRRLGLPAAECLAFEDSAAGVRAARAAGLVVVAVPAPEDFDDPGFDRTDLKLRSLEDFDLHLLGDS